MKIHTIFLRVQAHNKILNQMEPVILINMRAYQNPLDPNSTYYDLKRHMSEGLDWRTMLKFCHHLKIEFRLAMLKDLEMS